MKRITLGLALLCLANTAAFARSTNSQRKPHRSPAASNISPSALAQPAARKPSAAKNAAPSCPAGSCYKDGECTRQACAQTPNPAVPSESGYYVPQEVPSSVYGENGSSGATYGGPKPTPTAGAGRSSAGDGGASAGSGPGGPGSGR